MRTRERERERERGEERNRHDHVLAYVALSRLTNRNGLLLIGLSYDAITASPEALAELARFDAMEQNQ